MGAGEVRLNTETENTMDFIDRIVNNKQKDEPVIFKKPSDNRLADKLDDFNFNFPSLPAYEGIQNDFYLKNGNTNQPTAKTNIISSQQYKPPVPINKFDNNRSSLGGISAGEMTTHSMGTLNSVNLEKVN